MTSIKIQELKKGDFFTVKPIENPKETQVYIKDEYNRFSKKYVGIKFNDICSSREFKKDTIVYTDFTF